MMNFEQTLIENPIIAAVRSDYDLQKSINSKAQIIFVLYGNIMTIKDICNKIKDAKKIVFIHLDMIDGIKCDHAGIEFIKKEANPVGIITTKSSNIKFAKQLGLYTILRIFVIDSYSLTTGIKNIKEVIPSGIELMPGIANKIIKNFSNKIKLPIIAGGLIETKKDVMDSLGSGALAISTTKESLWDL